MVNYFCSKCGKSIDKANLISRENRFMCRECSKQEEPMLDISQTFFFGICHECQAYSFGKSPNFSIFSPTSGNIVKDFGKAIFDNIINSFLKKNDYTFELEFDRNSIENPDIKNQTVVITAKSSNGHIELISININIRRLLCNNCANKHGKRYEAIL